MSKRRRRPADALKPAVPVRDAGSIESRVKMIEELRGLRAKIPKRLPRLYYTERPWTKEEIRRHNARLPNTNPYETDTLIVFNLAMFEGPEPVIDPGLELDPEPNLPPLKGEQ